MKKPLIYISGPIRGQVNGNRSAFLEASKRLVAMGFGFINPHDHDDGSNDIRKLLLKDFRYIADLECRGLFMLPNWQKSTGAQSEYWFARAIGLPVWYQNDFDEENRERFRKPIHRVKLSDFQN